MIVKCAECQCVPQYCTKAIDASFCNMCIKDVCCCIGIHTGSAIKTLAKSKMTLTKSDDCCSANVCKNDTIDNKKPSSSGLFQFFRNVKGLYSKALGIEILCIAAAEIGVNTGLYLFGFNAIGIPIAYAMGYALAGFTTFVTILGRYRYNEKIDSCCSVLGQDAEKGFISNLKTTLKNFAVGLKKIPKLHRQQNLKQILKSSAYILVTLESACILTAETVDLVLYQYSLLLAVPLALLAGAFAVVAPEAYKMANRRTYQ